MSAAELARVAKRKARARDRADAAARKAAHEEDCAIQDLAEELGDGRHVVSQIAKSIDRSPQHIRNALNRDNGRGHYADTSAD